MSLDQPAPFVSLFSRGVPLHLHTGRAPSRGRSTRPCLPAVSSAVSHLVVSSASFLSAFTTLRPVSVSLDADVLLLACATTLLPPLLTHRI